MPDTKQHIASLRARFTSGNEIPVERAMVPAVEVAAILAHIKALEVEIERLRLDALVWASIHAEIERRAEKKECLEMGCDFTVTIRHDEYAAIDAARKEAGRG